MTIQEIIRRADETAPNALSEETKLGWIAELDGNIALNVLLLDISEAQQFDYRWPQDMNREPLVNFPHQNIYPLWLRAKIDDHNGEVESYENSMQQYNAAYGNFVRRFASNYAPANGHAENPSYYLTAYGLAVKNGFQGTEQEWLESITGPPGPPGRSAYEYAVAGGYTGTEAEFALQMGRELTVAKISAAMQAHMTATGNPHKVSAEEIGAVSKAVFEGAMELLEAHVQNKENPHGVTRESLGAAEEDHTHQVADISGLDAEVLKQMLASGHMVLSPKQIVEELPEDLTGIPEGAFFVELLPEEE